MLKWDSELDDLVFCETTTDMLSPEHIKFWLELDGSHPCSPLCILKDLSWDWVVSAHNQMSTQPDGSSDLLIAWAQAANKYAGLTFKSGKWPVNLLTFCHIQSVNTWAIRDFCVTEYDLRLLILLDGTAVTVTEFEHIYGPIMDHLDGYKEQVADVIDIVKEQLVSELISYEVRRANKDAAWTTTEKHLACSSEANWVGGKDIIDFRRLF